MFTRNPIYLNISSINITNMSSQEFKSIMKESQKRVDKSNLEVKKISKDVQGIIKRLSMVL